MKRWLPIAVIALLAGSAMVISEWKRVDAPVGPQSLLYWLADTQHESTRVPAHLTRLSDEDEVAIGDEIAAQEFVNPAKLDAHDRELERYVQLVGTRLALHAHRNLPYRFHYITKRSFDNAFALPGGHIFIGAGLIALMDSEDELAATLAHELEHVDRYHCAERVQIEARTRHLGPIGELANLPIMLFQAGYGKDQEFEADREGVRLAVASGYSPYGARTLMEKFERQHKEQVGPKSEGPGDEVIRVGMQSLAGYFRSHPATTDRIANIDALIRSEGWQGHRTQQRLRVTETRTRIRSGIQNANSR